MTDIVPLWVRAANRVLPLIGRKVVPVNIGLWRYDQVSKALIRTPTRIGWRIGRVIDAGNLTEMDRFIAKHKDRIFK